MEIIGRHTFDKQRRVHQDPAMTVVIKSGMIQFNQSAVLNHGMENWNYILFKRFHKDDQEIYMFPTEDAQNGFKLTRYKSSNGNVHLKACSRHMAEYLKSLFGRKSTEKLVFLMVDTGQREARQPLFLLELKP